MSGIYTSLFVAMVILLALPSNAFGLNTTISKEDTDPSWVQSSLLTEPDLTETRYPKLSPEELVSPYQSAKAVLVRSKLNSPSPRKYPGFFLSQ